MKLHIHVYGKNIVLNFDIFFEIAKYCRIAGEKPVN